MHYVGNVTRPWDFSAETIHYHQSDLPVPKIHLMCLRLFYNALGGLYMCWAHFICSYISQEEFSVRLMATIHTDWVTCWDGWALGKRPRWWIISISKQIPTFPFLFPSNIKHIYYSVNPGWFQLIMYSHSLRLIDLHLEDKRMDIIFPTKWWGVRINILTVG